MGSLKSRVEQEADGRYRVTLAGSIDEESDLKSLFAKLDSDTTFDLGDVERVNSMGIHLWIPEITALSSKHTVAIERIAYPMVLQANTVANLFGNATVNSCFAPYFCGSCQESFTLEVAAKDAADGVSPGRTCTTCNEELEFDELDSYFYFLQRQA
jgi:hypothetical protein